MKSEYRRLAHTLDLELVARAIEIADAAAMGDIDTCSTLVDAHGWRDCSDEARLAGDGSVLQSVTYAKLRGLIEVKEGTRYIWRATP